MALNIKLLALSLTFVLLAPLMLMAQPLYIVGGTILTMTGRTIDQGIIRIEDGKITYIGRRLEVPETALQLNAEGKFITPGFIAAHSSLGLSKEFTDEQFGPITPGYRVVDQMDMNDPGFAEASYHGITTVNVVPYSRRPMAGVGALVKTDGNSWQNRIVSPTSALSIFLIQESVESPEEEERSLAAEVEAILAIRINLQGALDIKLNRERATNQAAINNITEHTDILLKTLNQEIPVMIYANTPTEIERGISLAEDFELLPIFINMGAVNQLWERFQNNNVNIIYGPVSQSFYSDWLNPVEFRGFQELFVRNFRSQILINDYGNEGSGGIRNMLYRTATLQRLGISQEEALQSITIDPARMLGVEDRLGTIEIGKDADLNIFSESPLLVQSVPDIVIIDGEVVTEARR